MSGNAANCAARTRQAGPQPTAEPRQLYALAVVDGGALVFGGGSVEGGLLGDAWSIDESTLDLQAFNAGGAPPVRSAATLIADPARHRVLLFGGENEGGLIGDTWELGPI